MDAALFLLVKKDTEIPTTEVRRKSLMWGETVYEEEVIYVLGKCEMKPCPISEWVMALLPSGLRGIELDSYLVSDSSVTHLESEVNEIELDEPSELSEWLLEIMRRSHVWTLAFLWHWDELGTIESGSPEEAVHKLRAVLRWTGNRHGFCVYGFMGEGEDPQPEEPQPGVRRGNVGPKGAS